MAERRSALKELEYFTGALVCHLKLLQATIASLSPRTRRKIWRAFEAQAVAILEDLMKEDDHPLWGAGFAETGDIIKDFFDVIEGRPPRKTRH